MTRSADCSAASTGPIPGRVSAVHGGVFHDLPGRDRDLTERCYAVRSTGRAKSRLCIWSVPGAANSAWCWRRSPPMPNPTRSPRCRIAENVSLKDTIVTVRCAELPARDRPTDRRSGRRYALALKGNQGTLPRRCQSVSVCIWMIPHARPRTIIPRWMPITGASRPEPPRSRTTSSGSSISMNGPAWFALAKSPARGRPPPNQVETAYYLLSKALTAERFNAVVRSHWGIENRLPLASGRHHERRPGPQPDGQ